MHCFPPYPVAAVSPHPVVSSACVLAAPFVGNAHAPATPLPLRACIIMSPLVSSISSSSLRMLWLPSFVLSLCHSYHTRHYTSSCSPSRVSSRSCRLCQATLPRLCPLDINIYAMLSTVASVRVLLYPPRFGTYPTLGPELEAWHQLSYGGSPSAPTPRTCCIHSACAGLPVFVALRAALRYYLTQFPSRTTAIVQYTYNV